MDYVVEYSVNGEIKMEVVSFEDFMGVIYYEKSVFR